MHRSTAKATTHNIARELNEMASTSSRVLRSYATKTVVKKTTLKLNFQSRKIASSRRLQKSKIIGIIANTKERMCGYVQALNAQCMWVEKTLLAAGEISIEPGRACIQTLLMLPPAAAGVFAVNDLTALGAFQAIKAAEKKIRQAIVLIGFITKAFGNYTMPLFTKTADNKSERRGS